jgi:hypothetical protein
MASDPTRGRHQRCASVRAMWWYSAPARNGTSHGRLTGGRR